MRKRDVSRMVGERIAKYRKARAMTQVQLAEALGIGQSLVAYYEKGARNIPLAAVIACARVLNVSTSELLGETDNLARKPGPKSVLEKQIAAVQKLPRTDQQFVSKFLDQVLTTSNP